MVQVPNGKVKVFMTYNASLPILIVLIFLMSTCFSHAESDVRNETVSNTPVLERPTTSSAYVSVVAGPGDLHGVNDEERLNFEVRFGSPFADERYPRLDIVLYNEGHPYNNHRESLYR